VNKKKQKKLFYSGDMGLGISVAMPPNQIKKSFWVPFLKKELLAF
jgi:hypothetical protein